jgi:hypothetical protein
MAQRSSGVLRLFFVGCNFDLNPQPSHKRQISRLFPHFVGQFRLSSRNVI